MDIGKSFSYPFEDKQWVSKMGLGAVISLVPILNFAMTGYMIQIVRNLMDCALEPLPNWDDLGKKFMDGVMLVLAGLVYGLSLLPSTSLGQTEETEEWANGSDQENSKAVAPSSEETSRGSHVDAT